MNVKLPTQSSYSHLHNHCVPCSKLKQTTLHFMYYITITAVLPTFSPFLPAPPLACRIPDPWNPFVLINRLPPLAPPDDAPASPSADMTPVYIEGNLRQRSLTKKTISKMEWQLSILSNQIPKLLLACFKTFTKAHAPHIFV